MIRKRNVNHFRLLRLTSQSFRFVDAGNLEQAKMIKQQTHPTDRLRLLSLSLALSMASMPVLATDWIVAPGVAVEQIYTDNAYLDTTKEDPSWGNRSTGMT